MKNKKILDKTKTIKNILDKCSSSIGFSIDVKKFNEKRNDENFIIEAAKFCNVEICYK